jgi:cation:H+ antiporter
MENVLEIWPLLVVLLSAFVIGWAAETAETFISRALALSILAWLQTLPEFAVEAALAWSQQRSLMIANLTGSLRLLVGLGWPMIFFTQFYFQGVLKKKSLTKIDLGDEDSISVLFLFISVMYFLIVLAKGSLTCWDSVFLISIYAIYLVILFKLPSHEVEDPSDLPWIGKKILQLNRGPQIISTIALFAVGGITLYLSVEPFIHTLQKWAVAAGISTFVFIQWVSPFLSEFPEKLSAFNWARQKGKAPMAFMNMVNSNINQWTMLAAMIPIVFNISLGRFEPITFDEVHHAELALTLAQSLLAGIILLDLSFSVWEASLIFILWLVQFMWAGIRWEVTYIYVAWTAIEVVKVAHSYFWHNRLPRTFQVLLNYKKMF